MKKGKFAREVWVIFRRGVDRSMANPFWDLFGLFQPVLYLLLFAPLLESLPLPGNSGAATMQLFVPGLIVMTSLFSTGFAGFGVIDDLRNGVIERMRVTSAGRLSVLLGMVLHVVLTFLLQCALIVAVAALLGFRAGTQELFALGVLAVLLGVMMTSASFAVTFAVRDEGGLAGVLNTFNVPALLLSGILLPMSLAPAALRAIASVNPFYYAVEAARAIVAGELFNPAVPVAFGLSGLLATLALLWAWSMFRKAMA